MFVYFEDTNCCIAGYRDPETEAARGGSTACGRRGGAEHRQPVGGGTYCCCTQTGQKVNAA